MARLSPSADRSPTRATSAGPGPAPSPGRGAGGFNEGLQLPAVRYQRGFERNTDIERLIASNSRTPELVLGDLRGQLGSSRLGEDRLGALIAKFGTDKALASFERLLDLAERRMRAA